MKPFWCKREGSTVATVGQTAVLAGQVSRVSPSTPPFSSTLWGKLQAVLESRRDQEEGGELDPRVSSEEIKSREVELG